MMRYRPLSPDRVASFVSPSPWTPGPLNPWTPIAGVDGGECDATLLPKVVWPSDVDRFKAQIDPLARATDTSIAQCAGISAQDKAEWSRFFASWRSFAERSTPLFGSSNEWEHACAAARTIDAWRAKVKGANCAVVGPEEIKGSEQEKVIDAVRLAAKSAIVIGAVVALVVYAPEIKAAIGSVLPKRKP